MEQAASLVLILYTSSLSNTPLSSMKNMQYPISTFFAIYMTTDSLQLPIIRSSLQSNEPQPPCFSSRLSLFSAQVCGNADAGPNTFKFVSSKAELTKLCCLYLLH